MMMNGAQTLIYGVHSAAVLYMLSCLVIYVNSSGNSSSSGGGVCPLSVWLCSVRQLMNVSMSIRSSSPSSSSLS